MSASYQGEGVYGLSAGDQGTPLSASGRLDWREGREGGAQSLRLQGVIGDHQVSADVAVVENTVHIFTRVSTFPEL